MEEEVRSRYIFRCSCVVLALLFISGFVFGGYLRLQGSDILPSQLVIDRDLKWMVFIAIGMTFVYVFIENLVDSLGVILMFLVWYVTLAVTVAWACAYSGYVIVGTAYLGCIFVVFGIFSGAVLDISTSAKAVLSSFVLVGIVALLLWLFTDLADDMVYLPLAFVIPFGILWVYSNHYFATRVQMREDEGDSYTSCVDAIMLPVTSTTDFIKSILPGPESNVETVRQYNQFKRQEAAT